MLNHEAARWLTYCLHIKFGGNRRKLGVEASPSSPAKFQRGKNVRSEDFEQLFRDHESLTAKLGELQAVGPINDPALIAAMDDLSAANLNLSRRLHDLSLAEQGIAYAPRIKPNLRLVK